MKLKTTSALIGAVLACHLAPISRTHAAEIRFDGVLGNSGADGKDLVQFGRMDADRGQDSGLGFDHLGHLWSFGGRERLIQYAPDGRMTASFPLPGKKPEKRTLVVTGDWVFVRVGEKLFKLPISAASGQQPEALKDAVNAISLNSVNGRVAVIGTDRKIGLLDPADGSIKVIGSSGDGMRGDNILLMPDGSTIVDGSWLVRENQVPEKLKNPQPASMQLSGGYIYTFSWHMTVARISLSFEPDPGVVFGGSSGYFIGSLLEDAELGYPRGIAPLGGNRFAIAGPFGIIHIVVWNADRQAFESVRRLGVVHFPATVALGNTGKVWFFSGYWDWTDGPDHILRSPTNTARECENAQAGILPTGQVVFPTMVQGKPKMVCRAYDEDDKKTSFDVPVMTKDPTGLAILPAEKGNSEILVVNGKGEGVLLSMNPAGKFRKVVGKSSLQVTSATPKITSLAALANGELLAADGGFLVRLRREGDSFREISRTNEIGADSSFGGRIFIANSGKDLWISDTENNRVIHTTVEGEQFSPPAVFTGPPEGTPLSAPQRISAAGDRAVVIDWNNQRLVKMSLER
ncbi:MAG: hypothetical protein WCH98_08160 [Verrucomicrobiota bacterium]